MPSDLYMWQEGGGLVHHCPQCQKPLTTPQAKTRCLGEHVEWCKNYHTQLFKKGMSGQCAPCRKSDEERSKRHREIAETILKIKHLRNDNSPAPASPLTPRTVNTIPHLGSPANDSPLSKRERKAAKKSKKVAEMAKGVTTADINLVSAVLRPENTNFVTINDIDEDEDVQQNIFFHPATSNIRHVRNTFVKQDRDGAADTAQYRVSSGEITGIMQLLNVAPITNATSMREKDAISSLNKKIEEDLVQLRHEEQGRKMRKAGFWRWANKKAFKRLLANGSFWADKDGDLLRAIEEDRGRDDSTGTPDTETTEADSEITMTSEEEEDDNAERPPSSDATDKKAIATPKTTKMDNEWTTVGKSSNTKIKKPIGKLTMVSNGGLDKMLQSPGPKSETHSPGFRRWFGEM